MGIVCLQSIGTAVPRYQASQEQVEAFMLQVSRAMAEAGEGTVTEALIRRVYRHSGIGRRASVLPDYTGGPAGFAFYPRNWRLDPFPTTADRMQVYQAEAPGLARAAAQDCLARAPQVRPEAISHLVVTSCTGMFAPGLDVSLVREMGLRKDVQREMIGFMGCYAAFNALRSARATCRADPEAVVLVVCVELCSLHFQRAPSLNNMISNCLFADGAAAALVTGERAGTAGGLAEIVDSRSALAGEDTQEQMTWTVMDTGFCMRLGAEVPESLRRHVPGFVDELLGRNGARREHIGLWAVHPGGRRILEVVQEELGLAPEMMAPSYQVLESHGNMSSPTVLFVLERCLRQRAGGPALGVALAFGPGLTLESLLLRTF